MEPAPKQKPIIDLCLPIGWIVPLAAFFHPLPLFLLVVGLWEAATNADFLGVWQVILTCVAMVLIFGLILWVPTMLFAFLLFAYLFRRARRNGRMPHYLTFAILASVCGFLAQAGLFLITDYAGSIASGDWEDMASILFYSLITALPPGFFGGCLLKHAVRDEVIVSN